MMALPNLIIPGAQKSATTTLYQLLATHPDIYDGERKEPHFFSQDGRYQQGRAFYQQNYTHHQNQKIIMDASQSYLPFDFVPQRIHNMLGPDIRFIIVLRHPIDRATSAFTHQKMKPGRELKRQAADLVPKPLDGRPLNELLSHEARAIQHGLETGIIQPRDPFWATFGYPFNYFFVSCYVRHISHYLHYFPQENFLFLTFEEVTQTQTIVLHKIATFLGISPEQFQPPDNFHANPSLAYKQPWLGRLLRPFKWHIMRRTLPTNIYEQYKVWERQHLKHKPNYRFDPTTHHTLVQLFQSEIEKTEALTGLDLSLWKQ